MTAKLGMTALSNSAGNQQIANANFELLSQLVQAGVVDKDLSTPPVSPSNGALYIVSTSATGAWAGKDKYLAWWLDSASAWTFLQPLPGFAVRVLDELDASGLPRIYGYTGAAWAAQTAGSSSGNQCIPIACSDEASAITTGTAKVTFRMPFGFTLSSIRASLTVAQSSGALFTVNVKEGGTTILSTKLTFDNSEKSTVTAAAPPVISDTALADDSEITIDVDQIGDGTAKGLKVYLIGVPS